MESSGKYPICEMPYIIYVPSEFGEINRRRKNMATFDTAISVKEMGL